MLKYRIIEEEGMYVILNVATGEYVAEFRNKVLAKKYCDSLNFNIFKEVV